MSQAYRRLSDIVQRAKSLEEAGQISIDYQPQYQQLELNSLDVWRAGKRIDMRTRAHYAILRRESGLENGLIDGALTLSITLPDRRVGDRVDYGVTISGSNPVSGKGSCDVFEARQRAAGRAPGTCALSRRHVAAVAHQRAGVRPQCAHGGWGDAADMWWYVRICRRARCGWMPRATARTVRWRNAGSCRSCAACR
ncbi:hypothetical protein LA23_04415 [Xanthomonas oryzae pv. oryzae]|nr:hypothetical protein LA23_04415 [Xanthomonas oryzae pv. oryzae]